MRPFLFTCSFCQIVTLAITLARNPADLAQRYVKNLDTFGRNYIDNKCLQ
ncbi:hypothetical protein BN8_04249 [Fibrisoma limi BUZ 3]|uniref:Uncharacterized protein n=1 Tax=Fibrisoma limi BUZ 3 TaxID=1185876 RepID=I2GM92_9BACT|nr:hypothetical protein BN8_04249 [Fibrisoma limi BUZ 3]